MGVVLAPPSDRGTHLSWVPLPILIREAGPRARWRYGGGRGGRGDRRGSVRCAGGRKFHGRGMVRGGSREGTHLRRVGSSIPPPRSTAVPCLSYIVPDYPVLPRTSTFPGECPSRWQCCRPRRCRVAAVSPSPSAAAPFRLFARELKIRGVAGPDSHLSDSAEGERPPAAHVKGGEDLQSILVLPLASILLRGLAAAPAWCVVMLAARPRSALVAPAIGPPQSRHVSLLAK